MTSTIDANQAAALIASHVNRKLQAKSGTVTSVQTEFCTVWAQYKPALVLIEEFLGFIPVPGTSATVGGLLAGMIAVTDQIQKQVCPAPAAHPPTV